MKDTSLDSCLELVADRRRRLVIDQLRQDSDGETSFDTLLEQCSQGVDGDRTQIAAQLYHKDLPKLASHGVVEFDAESRRVRYRSSPEVEMVLDSLPEELAVAN